MHKTNARSSPAPAQGTSFDADGSQYFPLCGELYFDPKWHVHLGARILQKFMSIQLFHLGRKRDFWEGELGRRELVGSGIWWNALEKYLLQLDVEGLTKCVKVGRWKEEASRWKVSNCLRAKAGGLFLATRPYKDGSLAGFSLRELYFLEFVTYRASQQRRLALTLDIAETATSSGLSEGTVRRARNLFAGLGLLVPRGQPRGEGRDEFYLNPVLIFRPRQTTEHFTDHDDARVAWWAKFQDQNRIGADFTEDQNRIGWGSFSDRWCQNARENHDQNRINTRASKSLGEKPHGAQRYIPSNPIQGGDGEGERRSPSGQDRTPRIEGVVLSADEQAAYGREAKALHDRILGPAAKRRFIPQAAQEKFRTYMAELDARYGKSQATNPPEIDTPENSVGRGEEQDPYQLIEPPVFYFSNAKGEIC